VEGGQGKLRESKGQGLTAGGKYVTGPAHQAPASPRRVPARAVRGDGEERSPRIAYGVLEHHLLHLILRGVEQPDGIDPPARSAIHEIVAAGDVAGLALLLQLELPRGGFGGPLADQ